MVESGSKKKVGSGQGRKMRSTLGSKKGRFVEFYGNFVGQKFIKTLLLINFR